MLLEQTPMQPATESKNLDRAALAERSDLLGLGTVTGISGKENGGKAKAKYKTVPEDWRTIPPNRFATVLGHLEAVLLEITVDRTVTSNVFDWKPTLPTLQVWSDHLRAALKALTK